MHRDGKPVLVHVSLDGRAELRGAGREHAHEVGRDILDAHRGDTLDLLDGARDDGGQDLGRDAHSCDLDLFGHDLLLR